jgi:hypothetical protein
MFLHMLPPDWLKKCRVWRSEAANRSLWPVRKGNAEQESM